MKFYFPLFLIVLFFSCSTSKDYERNRDRENLEKMRYESLYANEKTYLLKGKAVFKTNYCDAAKPPNNWLQLQPFSNVKNTTLIFQKANEANFYFTTKTDSLGLFSIPLIEGVWRYYLTESFKPNNAQDLNDIPEKCEKFYDMPFGSFEIKKDTELDTVYFNDISFYQDIKSMRDSTKRDSIYFYLPCNPCDLSTKP